MCCSRVRGIQDSTSYPEKSNFPGNTDKKSFKHLLQPLAALWERNPHTFLLAGISHATHERATRAFSGLPCLSCIVNPDNHPIFSCSTNGVRYELSQIEGSEGPGIIPI